jgi:endonuclease/exonuclease/phosphatase family metal-dependent hydrolase
LQRRLQPESVDEHEVIALRRSLAGRCGRAARKALVLAGALVVTGGAAGVAAGALNGVAAGAPLRVASYNVQFVTPDLPLLGHVLREWPGHKPNVATRAKAIAERLACFDLVALQETINRQRRREILDRLEAAGRECGKSSRLASGGMFAFADGPDIERGFWLPLVGNELTLASRWPIVRTGAHIYRHAAEEDALAAKGALYARLARNDDTLDVFVTHLQAGDEHGAVRRAQIEELAAFIRREAAGGANPVLVLGDFNVRGSRVDRQEPGSDYNFLRRALDAAVAPRRFADAWLATHADDPETDSGTKPRQLADGTLRPHEERVDYLFVAGREAMPERTRIDFFASDLVVDGAPVGALSDHAALLAEITWSGMPKPARLAGSGP